MWAPRDLARSATDGGSAAEDKLASHVERSPDSLAEHEDSGNRAHLLLHLLRVKKSRLRLGQRAIAKRMKTTQSVVSELEQGNTDARLSALQRYARAVGCRIDLVLVDTTGGKEQVVWQSRFRFKTSRKRELQVDPVRVEKDPQKIWGSKLGLQYSHVDGPRWATQWREMTHSIRFSVNDVYVVDEPDEFFQVVSRG